MQRALAGMFPRAVLNTLERSSWGLQYARQLSASSTYLQGHDSPSSITTSDPFQGRLQQRTEEQLARMVDEGPSNRTQSSETQVEGNEEQKVNIEIAVMSLGLARSRWVLSPVC